MRIKKDHRHNNFFYIRNQEVVLKVFVDRRNGSEQITCSRAYIVPVYFLKSSNEKI